MVVLSRDGVTDHCGLVNSKNIYGVYVGLNKCYVQLISSDKGTITDVRVREVANGADNVSQLSIDTIYLQFGYGDLSAAK